MCDKCLCFHCVHCDDDYNCKGGLCWWCCNDGIGEHLVEKCDKFEKEVDIFTKKQYNRLIKRKRGKPMKYQLPNGKNVTIPDGEIKKSMLLLNLSRTEAIQMWLEDNDYMENEEQAELDAKAKKVKIVHDAKDLAKEKKERKPRTSKVSDTKKEIFNFLENSLKNLENATVSVEKENKLLIITKNDKIFKLDLVETRQKGGKS